MKRISAVTLAALLGVTVASKTPHAIEEAKLTSYTQKSIAQTRAQVDNPEEECQGENYECCGCGCGGCGCEDTGDYKDHFNAFQDVSLVPPQMNRDSYFCDYNYDGDA